MRPPRSRTDNDEEETRDFDKLRDSERCGYTGMKPLYVCVYTARQLIGEAEVRRIAINFDGILRR